MLEKISKKLNQIQCKLKCSKSQYNQFGKYKYRNQEDILESLKPLLNETGTAVIISDEIISIGERVYVKATAKLVCSESGEYVAAEAYAREPEDKKGLDAAQITGSTSSYARKYALNGLFAIDDTKDSDYGVIEQIEGQSDSADSPLDKQARPITPVQLALIRTLIKNDRLVCDYYKVNGIEELTQEQAAEIISKKKKRGKPNE